MNPTNDLYELIKSLSKAEKRYIKVDAQKTSSKLDYIVLFEAIEKQKVYDEKALKSEFKNYAFAKRLAETKYYLYETILKNLKAFHTKKSIDMKIREMIDFAEILYMKGLYNQCTTLINKITKIAKFHERNLALLEVTTLETKLLSITKNVKGLEKLIKQIDQSHLLNKHVNTLHYSILAEKKYSYQSSYFLNRNKNAFDELLKIKDNPLIKDESSAFSVDAKSSFYRLRAHYYGAICDYENAYNARLACVKMVEHYPAYLKHHLEHYKASIYMFLLYAAKTKRKKEFDHYYDRFLLSIKMMNKEEEEDMIAQSIYLKNSIYIETGAEVQRIKELNKINSLAKLKNYHSHVELTGIYFMESMSILYFNAGIFAESLYWNNKLINHPQTVSWLNNYSTALKINILIHYELDNLDLLENLIKSAERFLVKNKILFDFDRLFISTFKKLIKRKDKKEEHKILSALKKDILLLNQNAFEKLAFYYFNYLRWVEKKLSK